MFDYEGLLYPTTQQFRLLPIIKSLCMIWVGDELEVH